MNTTREEKAADPVKEFALLVSELGAAQAALCEAQTRARAATAEEVRCLNRANDASKALDLALYTLRKASPRGTDWHSTFVVKMGGA